MISAQFEGETMPRTVQDILDHGDEMAKRFGGYDPPPTRSGIQRFSSPCVRPFWAVPRPRGRPNRLSTRRVLTATLADHSERCWGYSEKPFASGTAPAPSLRVRLEIGISHRPGVCRTYPCGRLNLNPASWDTGSRVASKPAAVPLGVRALGQARRTARVSPPTRTVADTPHSGGRMTESTAASVADPPAPANRGGYKQGLPKAGLRAAEESAQKLWEVARRGTAAKEVFGGTIGMPSITASSFRLRMAVLKGFGLVKVSGNEVGLSDVGLNLVQGFDDDKRRTARRQAILSLKAYREVVETFEGTELLSKEKLAAKLQFEYGKPHEFAMQAAEALIDSLVHAEMLDASNIVRREGSSEHRGAAVEPVAESSPEADVIDEDAVAAELDEASAGDSNPAAAAESVGGQGQLKAPAHGAIGGAVTLALTLDLSKYGVDEVIQILQALGMAGRG